MSSFANYHCQSPYFSIKSEYQNYSAFDFLFFKTLSASKIMLPFHEFRCITILILWLSFWRLCLFKPTLWHVQSPNICHAESPAGRVQCFKMAEIDPVSPFCLTLIYKKAILQCGNLQEIQKTRPLHSYRWPTMKIHELWWCLTEITFNNPSQFPGMF